MSVKHNRTSCYLQPPFLGSPLVPSRIVRGARCNLYLPATVQRLRARRVDTRWFQTTCATTYAARAHLCAAAAHSRTSEVPQGGAANFREFRQQA